MATPTCTQAVFIDDATCYTRPNVDPIQQMALLIYAKVLELQAVGGTDYRDALVTTLITDTKCPPYMSDDAIMAGNINVAFNNAEAAGASVPATLEDAVAAIKCLQYAPGGMATLKRIDMFLNCALGPAANQ